MKKRIILCLLSFFILVTIILSGCEALDTVFEDTSATELSTTASFSEAPFTVAFIDVGQGDSALIKCGDETMLIDAGTYSERLKVISYLNSAGITSLDYCVATHPHSDHIGGMDEVIYNFDVDTLVYPLCETDSASWNYVLDACDERGVSYYNPQPEDSFYLGDALVTVLSPSADADYDNLNNYSIVLKVDYKNTSFLFTGDAETEVEYELLEKGYDITADVLKCGHHGSSTSSSSKFINAVNPAVTVISCGKDNDYGHPHRETISTLSHRQIEIYRTDILSTITASSDGETITLYAENETLGTFAPRADVSYLYIGNKNSQVFHIETCNSVENMSDKNKVIFQNRENAVNKGYSPCKSCNP